tara:strand:- start:1 stop:312 length:312 start_codon:yes stop_codon:yes gene_type:complete
MTYQSSIFDQWVGASPSPQEIIDGGREQLEQNIQGLCADQSFMRDAGYSYVGPAAQRDIVQCIWDEAIKRTEEDPMESPSEGVAMDYRREIHDYLVEKGEREE